VNARIRIALLLGLLASGAIATALADAPPGNAPPATAPPALGLSIAYALTNLHWANYQTPDGKAECPHGFNEGNREQFKKLYPETGAPRALQATQLQFEINSWYPTLEDDGFSFLEAQGPTALGLNLDGKVGPNDFKSPEGEPGVDNQLYRALGCIKNYRGPDGAIQFFDDEMIGRDQYNRILFEITGAASLVESPHVTVTLYRGRDPLLYDATGKKVVPGGSQRIDTRWGARFIQQLHGSIHEGVLTTEPADLTYPWAPFYLPTDEYMHAARLRLKLTPTAAEGLIAGYSDVETWYLQMMKNWSTHHQNYGQTSAPSLYRALRRLADAYPDPATGANTAISSALRAEFTQILIVPASRPDPAMLAARPHMEPYHGPPFPRLAPQPAAAQADRAAPATSPNRW
jgi:hypothetical protein